MIFGSAKLVFEARAARASLDPTLSGKAMSGDAETLWKKSVLDVAGQNTSKDGKTIYGGVATAGGTLGMGGYKVFVPPWIKQDGGIDEVMGKLRLSDFVAMSPTKGAAAAAGRIDSFQQSGSVLLPHEPTERKKVEAPSTVEKPANAGPRWQPPPGKTEVLEQGGVQSIDMPGTPSGKPLPMEKIRSAQLVWAGGSRYLLKTGTDGAGNPQYIGSRGTELNYILDIEKMRPLLESRVSKDTFRQLDGPAPETWREPGPAAAPMPDNGKDPIWDPLQHKFRAR